MIEAPPPILAEGLRWTYRGATRPALDGLHFRLDGGQVLLVLGPSGSGKSTLARALAGIVPHALPGAWTGRLSIGADDVPATPPARLGQRVGLVFQDPESQLVMPRVEDEVAFGLENRGWPRPEMLRRVPQALALAGLSGFEPRASRGLSGGEQQRLALAGVLAPLPRLLVFDEPTANLDPPGMQAFFARLGELATRREHTIVVVEHRLEAVLPLADRALLLDEAGRQLAYGPPAEIGPVHAGALERSGGWVPAAWRRPGALPTGGFAARGPSQPVTPSPVPAVDIVAELEGVAVRYGADRDLRTALVGVDLVLRAGERVGLVGPNGSGKSSLLFVLAGARRPSSGAVVVRDASGAPHDPRRLPSTVLPGMVGLAFQDPEIGFVGRTVGEELGPGAGPALVARFGLDGLEGRDPYRLSQGQQRRLSLAALAARNPRLLLLDEPTYGLDRLGSQQVVAFLDEGRVAGQAQLLATHDPRLLPDCDRVVALEAGRVVFEGSSAAFLAAPPFDPPGPWQVSP